MIILEHGNVERMIFKCDCMCVFACAMGEVDIKEIGESSMIVEVRCPDCGRILSRKIEKGTVFEDRMV